MSPTVLRSTVVEEAQTTGLESAGPSILDKLLPDEQFPGVVECPMTAFDHSPPVRVASDRAKAPLGDDFAPEWVKGDVMAADATVEEELAYFRGLKADAKKLLHENGAIVLRGFDLMKTPDGFQAFYLALGMEPCDDPLQSVAARDAVNKDKGLYEAVNKESRSKYFVGMHNEQVGIRSPRRAAFVCFQAADEGGEFLLNDCRAMFRDLPQEMVEELYEKQVRFIAAEIPLGFFEAMHPAVRRALEPPLLQFAEKMAKQKVDFDIDLVWNEDAEGKRCIHAIAPPQPPIVRHPETNEPVFFCNVHSHSDKLRQQREVRDGTVALSKTTGASRLNRTDIRFGDLTKISDATLAAVDALVMKNVKWVKMEHGDVVLLDNYACQHGRSW